MLEAIFPRALRRAVFAGAITFALYGCGTTPVGAPVVPSGADKIGVTSGPMLGYAWDAKVAGIRPIYGVAGAAQLGAAKYAGSGFSASAICAKNSFAVFTDPKGQASVAALPSGIPVAVTGQVGKNARLAISPNCSTALLYASGNTTAILISGLPNAPQPEMLELPSGALLTVAVSDAGTVLAGFQQSSGVTVEAVSTKGSNQVLTISSLAGIAFVAMPSGQQENALIADGTKNNVWLASNVMSNVSLVPAASAQQGISQPLAIAASSDGRWLIVANHKGTSLLRIDLTAQAGSTQTVCNCTATKLSPLNGNGTFLLSDVTSGPLWTFDGDAPSPRVVFIPGVTR